MFPSWLAETSVSRLPAGRFLVEVDTPERRFREPFAVVDAAQYKTLLGALRDERFPARSAIASTAELVDSWRSAFRGVPDFLCIPHREVVTFRRSQSLRREQDASVSPIRTSPNLIWVDIDFYREFEPTELQQLSREALQWAAFQVVLFLYDRLFFGGQIHLHLGRTPLGGGVEFAFSIGPNWPPSLLPLDQAFPEDLKLLLSSLESDGIDVSVLWKPGDGPELRLEWRRR